MAAERLFVALPIPVEVKAELARLQTPLEGVAWAPPQQFHVTLRFLGDVDAERWPAMQERLAAIRVEPFILPIEDVGVFPPKGPPRTLWAGTGRGHPRLFQLRQRLDDALLAAGVNFDVRTFHPHVTLGRAAESAVLPVKTWLLRHAEFEAAPFRIEGFGVYASRLLPAGPVHTEKRWFSL